MIHLVPVLQVDLVWPHVRDGMAKACAKGGGQYSEGWLHTMCRKGDAMLLVDVEGNDIRAGIVVQEQNWSGRIVTNVLAACGRHMREWIIPLKAYAVEWFSGKPIIFEGRPGWGAVVPGVRVIRHVYEVENGR